MAYTSTCLVLIAPLLVTLALKVNSLVGIKQAPTSLALVVGVGAAVATLDNPIFDKMSHSTSSPRGNFGVLYAVAGSAPSSEPSPSCP